MLTKPSYRQQMQSLLARGTADFSVQKTFPWLPHCQDACSSGPGAHLHQRERYGAWELEVSGSATHLTSTILFRILPVICCIVASNTSCSMITGPSCTSSSSAHVMHKKHTLKGLGTNEEMFDQLYLQRSASNISGTMLETCIATTKAHSCLKPYSYSVHTFKATILLVQ